MSTTDEEYQGAVRDLRTLAKQIMYNEEFSNEDRAYSAYILQASYEDNRKLIDRTFSEQVLKLVQLALAAVPAAMLLVTLSVLFLLLVSVSSQLLGV